MEVYSLSVLEQLEAESIHILRETAAEFRRPTLLFSGGTASCVLLRIAQKAFAPEGIPFHVLVVDGPAAPNSVRQFRDRICLDVGIDPRKGADIEVLDAISRGVYDAVIDDARRDEACSQSARSVFSLHDARGRQPRRGEWPEFWNLYNTRRQDGEWMKVHPLANWEEVDLWRHLKREGVALPAGALDDGTTSIAPGDLVRIVLAGASGCGKSVLAARLPDGAADARGSATGSEYRQFSSGGRRLVLIDVPGSESSTPCLAAGASHADLAVLLIDAQQGLVSQTRRHAFICSLFGIPRLIVAVSKMDLVAYEAARFRAIRQEFETFAARLGFKSLIFLPISGLGDDNVIVRSTAMSWYDGQTLLEHLNDVYVGGDRNLVDFRFAVQSVGRSESGRWYRGQIGSGIVKVGDEVAVVPSHRRTRVRQIAMPDGPKRAFAPLSASIALEDEVDVGRGALLAHPANMPRAARSIDAMVFWMHESPLSPGQTCLLRQSAGWVRASCAAINYRIDPDRLHRDEVPRLHPNDIGRVMFTLFEERYVDAYTRNRSTGCFLVVNAEDGNTLGAAVIVDRETEQYRVRARKAAERVVVPHIGKVSESARSVLLHQRARTIWLTGLSGSGKSTLATELERELVDLGHACFMLDGDNVRGGLNRDLGFGPDDRSENIRRIAEVARLMNDAGLIAITAFISPYRADRDMARKIIGAERFVEVYLDASLEACEKRDPKGLYRKARAGEIAEFTGVSAPYEPPESPALTLDTADRPVEECTAQLLAEVIDRIRIG